MVFVYMGIAVVLIFLFFVVFYNRKKIFKKREKPVKAKKVDVDPDTYVDPDRIEVNDFSDPIVKEYENVEQVLTPEEELPKVSNFDELDNMDYQHDMFERASEYFEDSNVEDEVAPEGPDGTLRDIVQQRISIGSHSLTNKKPSIHGDDDDDYDEMISDFDFGKENASFAKRFAELPPDMKALMMSDILNRKY